MTDTGTITLSDGGTLAWSYTPAPPVVTPPAVQAQWSDGITQADVRKTLDALPGWSGPGARIPTLELRPANVPAPVAAYNATDGAFWRHSLPQQAKGQTEQRNECWPNLGFTFSEGDTSVETFDVRCGFNPAAAAADAWHNILQHQGPRTGPSQWTNGNVGLQVRKGYFQIGGGGMTKTPPDWTQDQWIKLIRYDAAWHSFVLTTHYSSDPAVGWFSCVVDGKTLLDHFATLTGTIYADQPTVQTKLGYYRDPALLATGYVDWRGFTVVKV